MHTVAVFEFALLISSEQVGQTTQPSQFYPPIKTISVITTDNTQDYSYDEKIVATSVVLFRN